MHHKAAVFLGMTLISGCASLGAPPATPDPKVLAGIATACMASGLFEAADGTLSTFVPAASLPVALINAGVDKICANPAQFATDATVVVWLINQLAAVGHNPLTTTMGKSLRHSQKLEFVNVCPKSYQ